MKRRASYLPGLLTVAALVTVIGPLAWSVLGPGSGGDKGAGTGCINVPEFSAIEAAGRTAFDANCAMCQGPHGSGTEKGPPFMHAICNPGYHSDESFRRAVRQGVRQHHWRLGDTPPRPQVTDRDLAAIVRYVRALQKVNGIVFQPHQM